MNSMLPKLKICIIKKAENHFPCQTVLTTNTYLFYATRRLGSGACLWKGFHHKTLSSLFLYTKTWFQDLPVNIFLSSLSFWFESCKRCDASAVEISDYSKLEFSFSQKRELSHLQLSCDSYQNIACCTLFSWRATLRKHFKLDPSNLGLCRICNEPL